MCGRALETNSGSEDTWGRDKARGAAATMIGGSSLVLTSEGEVINSPRKSSQAVEVNESVAMCH